MQPWNEKRWSHFSIPNYCKLIPFFTIVGTWIINSQDMSSQFWFKTMNDYLTQVENDDICSLNCPSQSHLTEDKPWGVCAAVLKTSVGKKLEKPQTEWWLFVTCYPVPLDQIWPLLLKIMVKVSACKQEWKLLKRALWFRNFHLQFQDICLEIIHLVLILSLFVLGKYIIVGKTFINVQSSSWLT